MTGTLKLVMKDQNKMKVQYLLFLTYRICVQTAQRDQLKHLFSCIETC